METLVEWGGLRRWEEGGTTMWLGVCMYIIILWTFDLIYTAAFDREPPLFCCADNPVWAPMTRVMPEKKPTDFYGALPFFTETNALKSITPWKTLSIMLHRKVFGYETHKQEVDVARALYSLPNKSIIPKPSVLVNVNQYHHHYHLKCSAMRPH